ncbi:hypothetical protein OG21DRAFT_296564 [Imleria badia]|nr:hypothetical protein OG21DRAFT_296564 [Imleria badia]
MIHLLFVFLYLAQLAQGTSTDTTSSICPPPDGTTRSFWSIVGSCALTLLICVWHAIHFDLPKEEWYSNLLSKGSLVLAAFFMPEVIIADATEEWWKARRKVIWFRDKGYEWSMTHSLFAEMGGFIYRGNQGSLRKIHSLEFLELCEENKIANPVITAKEIKDKSKSDGLGKAILALQLLWFTLQVVVRVWNRLAITLIELDTVCMAVLTLLLLFIWRDKPLRPGCPHVFYSSGGNPGPETNSALSQAWKSEPCYLYRLMGRFVCKRKTRSIIDEEKPLLDNLQRLLKADTSLGFSAISVLSLCTTWCIFGGLHLTAWSFPFVTEGERMTWRIASLILAGAPLAYIAATGLTSALSSVARLRKWDTIRVIEDAFLILGFGLAVLSRMALVGLMFASLRSVPCSAYQTVSWTTYIPHL